MLGMPPTAVPGMFGELKLLPVGLDPPGPKILDGPGPPGVCPNPFELLPDPLCEVF